jgi:hypothetical protein
MGERGFRDAVRRGVQLGAGLSGVLIAVKALIDMRRHGGLAKDAHAYWLTAHHASLYGPPPGSRDAYLYSPAVAQVIHPLALLPFPWFACIIIACDIAAFVWMLFPLPPSWAVPLLLLTAPDLVVGQVTGIIAMAVVLAVLGRAGWWSVGWLTKVAPGALGVVWHVSRFNWRQLLTAAVWTAVVTVVSFVLWPSAWVQWWHFLTGNSSSTYTLTREVAAVILVVIGARLGWWWVIPVALVISAPVLGGFYVLTPLVALVRLAPSRRDQAPAAVTIASVRNPARSPISTPT